MDEINVTSQFVDAYGKSRSINVKIDEDVATILTPPQPVRDVRIENTIHRINYSEAKKLIEKLNGTIVLQNINGDVADGLWFTLPDKFEYFIPIDEIKPISGVDYDVLKIDPLSTDDYSILEGRQYIDKVGALLKTYALYEYSKDPLEFGEKSFVVVPDVLYDLQKIGNRVTEREFPDGVYLNKKLVVDSDVTRKNLLSYVNVQILNNEKEVLSMKNKTNYLHSHYTNLQDFKELPNQIVFVNRESIEQWVRQQKTMTSANLIHTTPQPKSTQPYFYENSKVHRGVVIVQNVKMFQDALAIGEKWHHDRVNLGYYAPLKQPLQKVSYEIYREEGLVTRVKKDTEFYVKIFEYYEGNVGVVLILT